MLALSLPDDLETRLEHLSRVTGVSKSVLAEQAIAAHIEDLEDAHIAAQRLAALDRGESETIPLEVLMKRHGLAD